MKIDKKLILGLSTRGEFSGAATFGDRVKERFEQKKKEQEQNSLNSQQKEEEQEMQWETFKKDLKKNMEDSIAHKVIFTALFNRIDYLEERIRNLELSESVHYGLFR